jgi:hypothetical protein
MPDPVLDALPPRSVAITRGFSGVLNRSLVVGGVVTVALSFGLVFVGFAERAGLVGPWLGAALGALLGVLAAIAVMPVPIRRAFEAYSWLGHAEVQRFKARTGSPVPTRVDAITAWLATNPPTPALLLPRIEMLAFLGRHDEARAALDQATATNDEEAFELASLHQYVDWLELGSTDLTALKAASASLPAGSAAERSSRVTLAVAEARMRVMGGDAGWTAPIEEVRPDLGRAPWRATLTDTWLPVSFLYFVIGLIASFAGQVLRAML